MAGLGFLAPFTSSHGDEIASKKPDSGIELGESNAPGDERPSQELDDEVRQYIAREYGVHDPLTAIWDVSDSYSFLKKNSLFSFWAADAKLVGHKILLYRDSPGHFTRLNTPASLPRVSIMLRTAMGPDFGVKVSVGNLARMVEFFCDDPEGVILDGDFVSGSDAIDEWKQWAKGNVDNEKLLKTLCGRPPLRVVKDGKFRLVFYIIMTKGSIEKWTISGDSDPGEISTIERVIVKKEHTYRYVLE